MRKIYLSMLLLMLCMTCAVANPITQTQALQKAKAFLQKKGMATTANLNLVYQGRQVSPQHGAPAKDPCYYVFNNGRNAGFIIMAGDDCAEEVLGYADSGTFDPNDIPDNMEAFLKGYVEEITAARARNTNNTTNNTEPNVEVELTRKVVAPLIQTHWNQQDPYNQQCYTTGGQQAVTGCVATALAQVMYYHKWPKGSTSVIPAYSSYGDLPSTTFKWDKMKPVYVSTGEDDEIAESAVAELMHYCGQAVYMSYGTGSSGASPYYIPNALKNYFGYPNDPQYVSRSSYTSEQWDELIYTELKYGRPVLYGAEASSGAGHEFICDGYDGHGLYHINWGWGGTSDGYFRLQALRPASQGVGGSGSSGGYSLGHDAIIGVSATEITDVTSEEQPEEPTPDVIAPLKTKSLKVTSATTIDYEASTGFSDVNIYYEFSLSGDECTFDLGFGLYKNEQPIRQMKLTTTSMGTSQVGSFNNKYLFTLGNNLSDGTYQIIGISRLNGTQEWLPNVDSDRIYIEVTINNGHATFNNVVIEPPVPISSLAVTSVEQRFDGDLSQIRANLQNTGEVEYSGSVYLLINDSNVGREGVYIPVGGEDYVDFYFTKMTGTVKLVVATDQYGNSPLYTNNSFIFSAMPELTGIGFKNATIKNIKNSKLLGAMIDGTIECENNSNENYEGYLTLTLYIMNSPSTVSVKTQLIPVCVNSNTTKTVAINYTGLTVGDSFAYSLTDPANNVLAGDDFINNFYWSFYDVMPAIVTWKATGERIAVDPETNYTVPEDVCAVSLEDLGNNLSSYNISLNNNPNTIYYVTGSATGFNPNGAIIVRGGIAGAVELVADKDFYIPQYFHADNIIYRWTPELGADGKNGWQTITLPFGVQSVNSAGTPIDWYRGTKNEGEKDFWVREFKQVVGNVVEFADAGDWVSNVPYIIAVPGDHWGAQYDLTNKEMQFKAEDVLVERTAVSAVVSDGFEFVGLTGGLGSASDLDNVYVLNANGSAFVPAESTLITGKYNLAYFTINDRTITPPACLNIGIFDNTDGISTPKLHLTDGQLVDVYAINGMKVSTASINKGIVNLDNLPKGVYIVEGKKVVKK